jgi:cell shape-determining protein MreC
MATTQRSKLQQSVQRWKNKAIQRGKSLKQLKKRLKELVASRNHWKRKAQDRQTQMIALQRENRQLRQHLNSTEKNPSPGPVDTPTAS